MSDKEEEEEENMKYPDTSYFSDIEPPPKVDKPKRTRKMTPETLEKLKVAREKAREEKKDYQNGKGDCCQRETTKNR